MQRVALQGERGPTSTEPAEKPATEGESPPALDTAGTEQIETLRKGVREALKQARELLATLEQEPAKSNSESIAPKSDDDE